MSEPRTPLQLVLEAQQTHMAATEANRRLADALTAAIQKLMPVGLVIDLNDRQSVRAHQHLVTVNVLRGNGRGTRVFRIESLPRVEVLSGYLDLAKWKCDATPISEKTGKDMSGQSHGASSRDTVTLQGDLFTTPMPEDDQDAQRAIQEEIDRLVAFLASAG